MINEKIKKYKELQTQISILDNEKKVLSSEILLYMQENKFDKLETEDSIVNIVERTNKSWDKVFLKEKLSLEEFNEAYKEKSKTSFIQIRQKKE
jgi:hypothetical protein